MLKKTILLIFCTFLVMGLISPYRASADDQVKVLIDGAETSFAYPVKTINGNVMVPMKQIFNLLGARVTYDVGSKVVLAQHCIENSYELIEIALADGYPYILIDDENGERWVSCVPPQIIEGTTYVPLRVIGESLRANVGWDGNRKLVIIETTMTKDINLTTDFFCFGLNYHLSRDRDKWKNKSGVQDNSIVIEADRSTVIDWEFLHINGETCPGAQVSINNTFLVTSPMGYFMEIYMNSEIVDKYVIRVHKDNKIIIEKTLLKENISERYQEPEKLSDEYYECKEGRFKIKFLKDWPVTLEDLPNGISVTAWMYIQPESEKKIDAPVPSHETIFSIVNSDKVSLKLFDENSMQSLVSDIMQISKYWRWQELSRTKKEINGKEALIIEYECNDSYGLEETALLLVTINESRIFLILGTASSYNSEELEAVYKESFNSLEWLGD